MTLISRNIENHKAYYLFDVFWEYSWNIRFWRIDFINQNKHKIDIQKKNDWDLFINNIIYLFNNLKKLDKYITHLFKNIKNIL